MKLQYIHDHLVDRFSDQPRTENRRTYCFELPDYNNIETEVVKTITDKEYKPLVSIKTGIAKCHPKDQYNKSLGRNLSFQKLTMVEFSIETIKINTWQDNTRLSLYSESLGLRFILIMKKGHEVLKITL